MHAAWPLIAPFIPTPLYTPCFGSFRLACRKTSWHGESKAIRCCSRPSQIHAHAFSRDATHRMAKRTLASAKTCQRQSLKNSKLFSRFVWDKHCGEHLAHRSPAWTRWWSCDGSHANAHDRGRTGLPPTGLRGGRWEPVPLMPGRRESAFANTGWTRCEARTGWLSQVQLLNLPFR